jgi:putative adenylate-forming enzyme
MNLLMVLSVLARRRALRGHERWSRERLLAYQARQLDRARAFAYARSPFYREHHRGLERAPLAALPPLSKKTLMGRFDDVVTDRSLRRADVEAYLATLRDNARLGGRYWVSSTSGSSGLKCLVPSTDAEWASVIAGYARANEWAGVRAGLTRRTTMAVVSSASAWHQSSRVAATVQSPFVRNVRFDAAAPLGEVAAGLDALQPEVLVAYASMLRVLAEEQLRGRLHIRPRAVNCSSEVLTGEARALATRAWGVAPFNVYAATETGGIGAECRLHTGLHVFEDLVVIEPVDEHDRPVPDGVAGDKLLVSVLSARTLPLLRYELTDRVRLATRTCPCGLPFRLIEAVEGRTDDLLQLPGRDGGTITVHPIAVHRALDDVAAGGWQVREEQDRLRVLIARPGAGFSGERVAASLAAALEAAGAAPVGVSVEVVDDIPAGAAGKRPLVVARRR